MSTPEQDIATADHDNPTGTAEAAHRLEPLMDVGEVADYFGVSVKTVYYWRSKRTGPKAIPVGKHLKFRPSDIAAWVEERADV